MLSLIALSISASARAAEPEDYAADAGEVETVIEAEYAYPVHLPGGHYALTSKLRTEAAAVDSEPALIRFAERALALLADHHAITGSSLSDSWALFPSYGDMWIEKRGENYVIEQVRAESPAAKAGLGPGDVLLSIAGVPTGAAVKAFWADLGAGLTPQREVYAARVLAAGLRDRPRELTIRTGKSAPRTLVLDNLYLAKVDRTAPLVASHGGGAWTIKFNDSLGRQETIAAFDSAMASIPDQAPVIIDLTDTAGGGNTSVARAIMSWFVRSPTAYQIHNYPAEERETGIARQWIEQVLPRESKFYSGKATVRVGRWTGSMGEGLAIGLAAIGARVEGDRMAGLLGAVYDYPLSRTGMVIKLPAERLFAVDGTPREDFVPTKIDWP